MTTNRRQEIDPLIIILERGFVKTKKKKICGRLVMTRKRTGKSAYQNGLVSFSHAKTCDRCRERIVRLDVVVYVHLN